MSCTPRHMDGGRFRVHTTWRCPHGTPYHNPQIGTSTIFDHGVSAVLKIRICRIAARFSSHQIFRDAAHSSLSTSLSNECEWCALQDLPDSPYVREGRPQAVKFSTISSQRLLVSRGEACTKSRCFLAPSLSEYNLLPALMFSLLKLFLVGNSSIIGHFSSPKLLDIAAYTTIPRAFA